MIRITAVLLLTANLVLCHQLDNDFENGPGLSWNASSYSTDISLAIEDVATGPAPQNYWLGTKYLATVKKTGAPGASGTTVYKSTGFSNPGDMALSFSYWMKSEWDRGNTLEVYVLKNSGNVLIRQIFSSLSNNNRWINISIPIPSDVSFTQLMITTYVSGNPLDGAAIDNLRLSDPTETTTTRTTTTTTQATSTAETTVTTTLPPASTSIKTTTEEVTTAAPEITTEEPETPTQEPGTITHEPEITSPEPEVTTQKPEITTQELELTTHEPEITTQEPEVTPQEPEVTTQEPEATTQEPEVTTQGPEVTTQEPEVTTQEPEVTNEVPEVTTQEPEATTQEPEVTTQEPEVTTQEPEVSPQEPEVTTQEPEVTTQEPEVTTQEPEITTATEAVPEETTTLRTTTTEKPTTTIPVSRNTTFDFGVSTSGWSLNEGNGASWVRSTDLTQVPSGKSGYLSLTRSGFYSGLLTTESPLLRADQSLVTIEIDFWVNGSRSDPALLQLFTKSANYVYSEKPVIDLSAFGTRPNPNWSKFTLKTMITQTDGLFQLVIQAALGQSLTNKIAVSSVRVFGAEVVTWPSVWDISKGTLNGWTIGVSQGSTWRLANDLDAATVGIPLAEQGQQFIVVEKFASRPGFVTMQSPLITSYIAGPRLGISFWVRGSRTSPAELTVRIRSENGEISSVPILDLRSFSTSDTLSWVYVDAPLPENLTKYQIVLEAFVGVESSNGIAVADLAIVTFEDGARVKRSVLFK